MTPAEQALANAKEAHKGALISLGVSVVAFLIVLSVLAYAIFSN